MQRQSDKHTPDPAATYARQTSAELPKMTDKEFDETIQLAISTFGKEAQTRMLFEEMAELQDALCKFARGRTSPGHVCEEIADVMIMCLQMAQIYGSASVEQWTHLKMHRLRHRLNSHPQ